MEIETKTKGREKKKSERHGTRGRRKRGRETEKAMRREIPKEQAC